jgi:inorganic triphosphatase YgiF
MSTPREIELKLTVARKDLRRLRRVLARFGRPVTETLETVYYDTRGFALADRKIALRLRRAGTRWLQTLKLAQAESPLSERIEYEMPVAGARLELRRFADTPLPEILRAERLKIGPRFRTRFARSVWMTPDGAVEIALDVGAIEAGKRSEPIVELELELKAGGPERLWELVGELAGQGEAAIALLPRADSKAARGVALALGRTVVPIKANAAAFTAGLRAGMSADAALRALIGAGTMILLANAHGLRATDDPEFVHQARVAVRRMRSAIRLLRDDVAFPRHLATGLRQIGRELGPARDWEVFISQTLPVLDVHSAALTRTASQRWRRSGWARHGDACGGRRGISRSSRRTSSIACAFA